MNYIGLLLPAFLLSSVNCLAGEEKFGVAISQNGILCASFGETPPPMGSSIAIIETQPPQYFFDGKVGDGKKPCQEVEKNDAVGPYYSVKTTKKVAGNFIGVAVYAKNTVSVVNNQVILKSSTNNEIIYFRSCTSTEGLHFSTWSGQPPKGQKLWHLYYYLDYDVEPSCQENDLR
jgi:hypothetical protein